jgi:hypothetical protein
MSGRTPINITSRTVYTNADSSDDQFNIFADGFLVLGNDLLTDDAITMVGEARVRAPVTIDDGLTLENTVTLVNASVLTQNGDLVLGQSSTDAVTVRNIAGATWDLANSATITGAGSAQFINLGLLTGSGTIDTDFYDRGGTIEGSFNFDGAVSRFVDDTIAMSNFNLGTGAVLDGSTVLASGDLWSSVRIVGDVPVSSNGVTAYNLNLAAGAVLSFTNSAATLYLSHISGLGEIDIKGDDTVYSIYDNGGFQLVGGVTFDNFGNTTFIGSEMPYQFVVEFSATAWAGDQITIENHAGATWTSSGAFGGFYSESGANATFYNDGIFLDSTYLSLTFDMDLVNDDLMESASNALNLIFDDAVTGTGTIDIEYHQVTANALVGSGQTLEFTPPQSGSFSPTLNLSDVQEFSGLISGFDSGVTNDQLVVNTATWHYQDFVANSGGTGGSLMFTNGSAETAVNLTGSYDPTGFTAVVSGSQTTITYTA